MFVTLAGHLTNCLLYFLAVIFDDQLYEFWHKLAVDWQREAKRLDHLTMVSIAGGYRDLLVTTPLTRWTHRDLNTIDVRSTDVDFVWTDADHLCIVWCNQLMRSVIDQ